MAKKTIKHVVVSFLLAAALFSALTIAPSAEKLGTAAEETVPDQDFIPLSSMKYIPGKSYSGFNGFVTNGSHSGEKIHLRVDGQNEIFDSGMGAHAKSCLIYDIGQYSGVQSRFTAFIGVDARQGDLGNGVAFTVSVSDDGQVWEDLLKTGPLLGTSEAVSVDVNVAGKRYLRLFADDLGQNGNDHAVYADAKLMKPGYDPDGENITPFKKVEEYDAILAKNTPEDNLANHTDIIYEREFVKRVGYRTLQKLYLNEQYREPIEYLGKDPKARAYFIEGGPFNRVGSLPIRGITAFCEIYNAHKDQLLSGAEEDFHLRLAISIADTFSYAENVCFWLRPNKGSDPVARYNTYIELSKTGGAMDQGGEGNGFNKWSGKQFRDLQIPMMRWVVDARMNEDEFFWLADHALKEKAKGKNFLDAYNYIKYTPNDKYGDPKYYDEKNHKMWNDRFGFDGFFSYGDQNVRRLWIVFAEGAVCGGLAKTYANLAEVFGRPSIVVGQPGHAATLTYEYASNQQQYIWRIQNDVSGWTKSNSEFNDFMLGWGLSDFAIPHGDRATYTLLAYDALMDQANYVKANQRVLLANSYQDPKTKEALYKEALTIESFNLDAWDGLTAIKLADSSLSSKDYLEYSRTVMKGLTYYPRPMDDLLKAIRPKITEVHDKAEFEMDRLDTLGKAETATADNVRQPDPCRIIAKDLLNKNDTYLASFSLDGEKAGRIVLNERYDESTVQVRYSIDGGEHWKTTQEHEIQLSEEELSQLSAEKDILVGLVGVKNNYTIDLVATKKPSANGAQQNDYENIFVGNTKNLEFSQDEGKTWCKYIPGLDTKIRFEGDQNVMLRYAASGHSLTSETDTYTFTANVDTPEKTYLQLQNVKLHSFSSQNNKGSEAAANLIDGNYNTQWHTSYGGDNKREYVVKFTEPKHISAVEYFPRAVNGRWRDVKVYVSMDAERWQEVGSVSLENNEKAKTISLDAEPQALYLKIQGVTTWGNPANKYMSGRMVNFYEDVTRDRLPLAEVTYSIREKTNQDVIASIALPEGCQMLEGDSTHTFTANGTHTFRYEDRYHNEYEVTAEVDWIRKAELTGTVTYSETEPTRNNVVVTIGAFPFKDVYVSNNDRSTTYTFTKNGSFTFELADEYGNTGRVTAVVENIDREAPKVHVEYSESRWTDQPVTATVVADSPEEWFQVVNNEQSAERVFDRNGRFSFEVQDKAGNTAEVIATVSCIDQAKSQVAAVYSTEEETYDPVEVTLSVNPEFHEIVNNGGADTVIFRENGSFVFQIRLRDSGMVVDFPVSVSNIQEKPAPQPQPEPEPQPDPNPQPEPEPEPQPEVPNKPWVPEPEFPTEPPAHYEPPVHQDPTPVKPNGSATESKAEAAVPETETTEPSKPQETTLPEASSAPTEKPEQVPVTTETAEQKDDASSGSSTVSTVLMVSALCIVVLGCIGGAWFFLKKKA